MGTRGTRTAAGLDAADGLADPFAEGLAEELADGLAEGLADLESLESVDPLLFARSVALKFFISCSISLTWLRASS